MSAMAFQITGVSIAYSAVCSTEIENIKAADCWPLWGEFPAQTASNAENISIWWRHNRLNGFTRYR